MERNFAQWYQLADPDADHERINSRWRAVENFSKKVDSNDIIECSRTFYGYVNKNPQFIDSFQAEFQAVDSTFPMDGNEFGLSILAGAILNHIIKTGSRNLPLISAYAIICPSFHSKREEIPIPDIVRSSNEYLIKKSSTLRGPLDTRRIQSPATQLNNLADNISTRLKESPSQEAAEDLSKFLKKLSSTLDKCVNSANNVQKQQNLDREESDILWWVLGQYSRDRNVPIKDSNLPFACLIAGKELADLTRILPGAFSAKAFIDKFLEYFSSDLESPISLKDCVNNSDQIWKNDLVSIYRSEEALDLCPMIFAISKSIEDPSKTGWNKLLKVTTRINPAATLNPVEFAFQLYQEILFLRSLENWE